jgi:hypothetical protein
MDTDGKICVHLSLSVVYSLREERCLAGFRDFFGSPAPHYCATLSGRRRACRPERGASGFILTPGTALVCGPHLCYLHRAYGTTDILRWTHMEKICVHLSISVVFASLRSLRLCVRFLPGACTVRYHSRQTHSTQSSPVRERKVAPVMLTRRLSPLRGLYQIACTGGARS